MLLFYLPLSKWINQNQTQSGYSPVEEIISRNVIPTPRIIFQTKFTLIRLWKKPEGPSLIASCSSQLRPPFMVALYGRGDRGQL